MTVVELGSVYDDMLSGAVPCPGTDRALGGLTRQIMVPHLHHPIFANNPAVDAARRVARELMRCDDPRFFSMLIYKPGNHPHETPWHQDMAYAGMPFNRAGTDWPNDAIAQFWLALDDVDETMGCMEFIPGAHRCPMSQHHVASGEPSDDRRLLAADAIRVIHDIVLSLKRSTQLYGEFDLILSSILTAFSSLRHRRPMPAGAQERNSDRLASRTARRPWPQPVRHRAAERASSLPLTTDIPAQSR